jgi:uncharacterized protein YggU (UPF0235/DUF167 family)
MHVVRIAVRVKPGSSRVWVGGAYGDGREIVVAVHAPPVDGAANDAVITALAAALDVRPSDGHTARSKVLSLRVDSSRAAEISARLEELRAG